MLPPEKIQQIVSFYKKGVSQRQISILLQVSEEAVSNHCRGEVRDVPMIPYSPEPRHQVRCSTCGGKVYMPCMLCETLKRQRAERAKKKAAIVA